MATPEVQIDIASALCSLGPRPILMTGLFRLLLIQHFQNASNVEHSEFGLRLRADDSSPPDGLWTNDDETGIMIESALRWKPELTVTRFILF